MEGVRGVMPDGNSSADSPIPHSGDESDTAMPLNAQGLTNTTSPTSDTNLTQLQPSVEQQQSLLQEPPGSQGLLTGGGRISAF